MDELELKPNQKLDIRLADGRVLHLWHHTCESCTSVDLWTTRGREVEEVSERTGDTTRAPMGIFTMTNGTRETLKRDTDEAKRWPAVGTIVAVWPTEVST